MNLVRAWTPVIIWMGIIFFLSSRMRIQVSEEESINFLFFKTLHILEYALLYILTYRALQYKKSIGDSSVSLFSAFVISIMYAASDEIHQTIVPTREGHPRDVIIDAIGITIAWITIKQLLPILPKKLRISVNKWLHV